VIGPALPAGVYHFTSSLVAGVGAQVSHADGILRLRVGITDNLNGSTLRLTTGSLVAVGGAASKGQIFMTVNGMHLDGVSTAVGPNRISGLYITHNGNTLGFWVATRIAPSQMGTRYTFVGRISTGPDSGLAYRGTLELWGDTFGGLLGWLTAAQGGLYTVSGNSVNGNVNMAIVVRAGTPLFVSGTTHGRNVLQGTIAGPLAGDTGTWTATP